MIVFKKKTRARHMSRAAALKCRPEKSLHITESRLETGEVLLEYPLTVRPWIAAVAKRLGKSPDDVVQIKKLQLDAMGTAVWDMVDGYRSVRRIVQIFAETHRLDNKEAEVSVTSFIRELGQRGLLGLQ
jgi:hypothetical protein